MDSCACTFNSFLASGDLCLLLITYASSLDPDQDRQKKANFEKKASRRQQKQKIPSMQRVKEGFDARAISVIRRRPVKCSGESAQLVRISCAFLGHSCNKYFILMGRFVTDVTSEDSNESDHPRILISAYNACAHNIYTRTFRTEAYWIVASAC